MINAESTEEAESSTQVTGNPTLQELASQPRQTLFLITIRFPLLSIYFCSSAFRLLLPFFARVPRRALRPLSEGAKLPLLRCSTVSQISFGG